MRIDSSDSDFEGPPVSKKALVEISDEELSMTSEVVVCVCVCAHACVVACVHVCVCTDMRTEDGIHVQMSVYYAVWC